MTRQADFDATIASLGHAIENVRITAIALIEKAKPFHDAIIVEANSLYDSILELIVIHNEVAGVSYDTPALPDALPSVGAGQPAPATSGS